jgi:hypothetical protein
VAVPPTKPWRLRWLSPSVGLSNLPPFLRYAATLAPDGLLWVQRTTLADAQPTFDVFDKDCWRVQQMTLPPGRRPIGFGNGSVYAVVRGQPDLQYLERSRFPILRM